MMIPMTVLDCPCFGLRGSCATPSQETICARDGLARGDASVVQRATTTCAHANDASDRNRGTISSEELNHSSGSSCSFE